MRNLFEVGNCKMPTIGERIKELREERRISQSDLAGAIKVSRMTIQNYEQGKRIPDINFAIKTSEYFDVTLDYLVGKSNLRSFLKSEDYDLTIKNLDPLLKNLEFMPQPETYRLFKYLLELMNKSADVNISEDIIRILYIIVDKLNGITNDYIEKEDVIKHKVSYLDDKKISKTDILYLLKNEESLDNSFLRAYSDIQYQLKMCSNSLTEKLANLLEDYIFKDK